MIFPSYGKIFASRSFGDCSLYVRAQKAPGSCQENADQSVSLEIVAVPGAVLLAVLRIILGAAVVAVLRIILRAVSRAVLLGISLAVLRSSVLRAILRIVFLGS